MQFLDVLQALLLIDFTSMILFLCALLGPGPGASCCVLQRHILHSLVCEDPPSVLWFQHPSEGYDSRDRSLWLSASLRVIDTSVMRHRHEPHDIAVRMRSLCCLTSTLSALCCIHLFALLPCPLLVFPCCVRISIAVSLLSPPPRVRVEIFALLYFGYLTVLQGGPLGFHQGRLLTPPPLSLPPLPS